VTGGGAESGAASPPPYWAASTAIQRDVWQNGSDAVAVASKRNVSATGEARAIAADCLQGYLESLAERGLPIPRAAQPDTSGL
jgi:hypothetical protein